MPPYRQIAAIIKRGILSGQYPPDTRIPTETELVETYEVARSTARRAVAALREEGLVYTVPARGTYVAQLDGRTGKSPAVLAGAGRQPGNGEQSRQAGVLFS